MKQLHVVRYFRYTILLPIALIAAAIISLAVRGVNLGIDFAGGTMITLNLGEKAQNLTERELSDKVEGVVAPLVQTDYRVSVSGSGEVIIYIQDSEVSGDTQVAVSDNIQDALRADYPDMTLVSSESVGAVVGRELVNNAITSLLLASALMLIYIWIRFEFWSGVAAIFGQFHDILVMLSVTLLFNMKINTSLVAAVLTVMGYSINNTIIVFDRIREYRKANTTHLTRRDIVNLSVTKTAMRSVNTSLTTLFTISALYIMGVTSVKEFTLPIIVGIFCGIYSSILLSGPFWAHLCTAIDRRKANKKAAERMKGKKAKA